MPSDPSDATAPALIPSHGHGVLRPWQPGQSGNPGGRPAAVREALRLARDAAPDAMQLLITMMADEGEDPRARLVAANAILDRALGKPKDAPPPDEKGSDAWGGMTADAMRQKIAGMMDSLASGRLTDAEAQAIMGAGGGVVVVLPDNGR